MPCDERHQVLRAHAHQVDDPDVREESRGGPLVNRGVADADELRDSADGEKSFDRR